MKEKNVFIINENSVVPKGGSVDVDYIRDEKMLSDRELYLKYTRLFEIGYFDLDSERIDDDLNCIEEKEDSEE